MTVMIWIDGGEVYNGTTPTISFPMVDATDGFTAETGKTLVETYSLDGAAFTDCGNVFSEVGVGVYQYTLNTTESGTDGPLVLRFTNADCRDTFVALQVVGGAAATSPQVNVAFSDVLTGYRLSATGVDDILDEVVEAGATDITLRQLGKALIALSLGESAGGGSTPTYRDYNDTKNVISYTSDSQGNRSAVTAVLT